MSEPNNKHCIHCWFFNNIKEDKKSLAEKKQKYQEEQKRPGYESSEEGKELKRRIELMEISISSHEKQLPEFTCLKNSFCNGYYERKPGIGINFKRCEKCDKYLSLGVYEKNNDSSSWKSQDYYIHEQNCQGGKENKDNPRERERERERESILDYFKSNNIKSIKMKNNKLIIKYHDKEQEQEANTQELQAIKTYVEKLGKSELSLSDLEKSDNASQTPKSNKALWWGLGIVGVFVVGVVVWLLVRNKNKEE